jgi:hypothetical protein
MVTVLAYRKEEEMLDGTHRLGKTVTGNENSPVQ